MKKRVLSIIALMCCILETFCMPVGATNLDQDEAEIIATEEFVGSNEVGVRNNGSISCQCKN